MNESYQSEVGLNGKPVVNTIQSVNDTSIDTDYLKQSIEDSIIGVDASEKVIAFKKKMLERQLSKQGSKKSVIKNSLYQDASRSVNQSLLEASMASQKKVITSKKKTRDEESKMSQVMNEHILYD
jgi:hypothetical protein